MKGIESLYRNIFVQSHSYFDSFFSALSKEYIERKITSECHSC